MTMEATGAITEQSENVVCKSSEYTHSITVLLGELYYYFAVFFVHPHSTVCFVTLTLT